MKTVPTVPFDDVVNEITERVNEFYDNDPGFKALVLSQQIIDEINGLGVSGKHFHTFTMDELSRISGKLSVLRASIIETKTKVLSTIGELKSRFSVRSASAWQTLRTQLEAQHKAKSLKAPTKDDIKAQVERALASLEFEISIHEAKLEKLNSYWYLIPNICDSISQRIRVLQGDKDTVRYYGADEVLFFEEDTAISLPVIDEVAEDLANASE